MDNSRANLIELSSQPTELKTIESKFTPEVKQETLGKSEHVMHNKEQHRQAEYYKMLSEKIREFDQVVLFGPTNAKQELYNMMHSDHRFAGIQIKVLQADKMTENQQHAFVREYFS